LIADRSRANSYLFGYVFKEASLNISAWIRQTHRWLSILFTLTVIANFVALALRLPPGWLVYSPLPFLFLLMFSGLYMFVLPYVRKGAAGGGRRSTQPSGGA